MLLTNPLLKDRCGIIKLPLLFLNDRPDLVIKVMSKVIVVRAEFDLAIQEMEYLVYSECFDVAPDGERLPIYEVVVLKDGTVIFKKEGE